jgi:hypothetical protein
MTIPCGIKIVVRKIPQSLNDNAIQFFMYNPPKFLQRKKSRRTQLEGDIFSGDWRE